ncbi:MAG: helix-turn-helix domain-containing protein [Phycisphaerae bacterium]|nr:helix-turn-helix domain-containing protein [Phycisphaerae bacterium]
MSDIDVKRMKIATRLRSAREMAGLSQAQVAKLLGLHRPSISEMEAGRRRVSADELAQLADIYSVDIDWLVGAETSDGKHDDDRVRLAARQLAKLKTGDLDRVLNLLNALRPKKGGK